MDNVIECEGEVLPDGNLPIPQEVRQQLAATPHTRVRVVIQILTPPGGRPAAKQLEDAWEAFEQLGQSPAPGRLLEASVPVEDESFWNDELGQYIAAEADASISVEEVRKALSTIPGSLAAEIRRERDER
ncbi:MAG TPA: hypothetical protein VNN62_24610 [Methylomirabilota bacterium]|nr:hypothetical protein [Methylomirabilota bacterium]